MKTYVTAMETPRKKERHYETQFTTKIGGKTNLGPFVKNSFPITHLMPYYTKISHSHPLIARLYE
jgi:hypothetical protein